MLPIAQVVTILLVAIAMACAVGHALELPGKRRLSQEAYLAVQPIYYPGFTYVGGLAEVAGGLAAWALLLITPRGPAFALTLSAALAVAVMHAVFWVVTQPVNKFWLRNEPLGAGGRALFRIGDRSGPDAPSDWRTLRDRWEYSHVVRAVLSLAALALLASATASS